MVRLKPRTGTGMVYRRSVASKMHAPLVLVLGSASVVGAAGTGGGGGGVPSIERATGLSFCERLCSHGCSAASSLARFLVGSDTDVDWIST